MKPRKKLRKPRGTKLARVTDVPDICLNTLYVNEKEARKLAAYLIRASAWLRQEKENDKKIR